MSRESSRRGSRTKGAIQQRPFKQPRLVFPPIRVISDDQVEAIHRAGLRLLRDIGFRVLAPEARALFAGAGATIDDLMVRFDPALIESLVAKAPSSFTLSARNPSHDLVVGDGLALFVGVGGPAYVQDLEGGRRPGSYAELEDYYRVMQSLNAIHQEGGGAFEPLDLDPETRHLDIHLATATLMDKNWQGVGLGRVRARDGMEMAALSLGLKSAADLQERPTLLTVINTNSPLVLDEPMAEGLIEFARFGQPVAVTPFTLAGAMSPITLAGALAQQHAEALATIALTQIVRPGCPVVYGAFTSNVDMKSGAPAFGTPEYVQAAQASGQLARRLKIPFRSSNVTSANEVDAQATYESMMALWGALLGGVNVLEHAAGWLGGGLTASFEKLVLDAELLQMMSAYFEPFAVDEAALAFDAVKDVGPGGHFFGTAHTLERYAGAFYQPLLSNYDNFDTWSDRGKISATQRAHTIWKKLLADYEKPPIDPSVEEALKDYVARRKRGWLPQA